MFKSMSEVRETNQANGYHFFDRKTMSFFRSRIESKLYRGKYFITSESDMRNTKRFYTIREAKESGNIKTVGEFQQFRHIEDARDFLREYIKQTEDES